jgi:hypothetical protein
MKRCIHCGEEKPLTEYYKHSAMADGHLGSCKTCVRAYVSANRAKNIDKVREYDRERGQDPKRKAAVRARASKYKAKKPEYIAHYFEKNPDKHKAHGIVQRAIRSGKLVVQPCQRCGYGIGIQAHHEDYSKPLDVVWLCPPCHGARHREINEERRRSA